MLDARTSDGVQIAYFSLGVGPPLLFASNSWGDAHFYRELHPHTRRMTDELAALGWRVVRYDLRGMGSSERGDFEMGAEALVRDLEAVVDALGVTRFALAGLHSGAATAVRFAAFHPGSVTRLVLLNPFVSGARRFGKDPVGRTMSSVSTMAEDDWSFFSLVAGNLVTKFANAEHARALAETFQRSTSAKTYLAYMEGLRKTDLASLLPRVEMPALVIHDTGFPFGVFDDCQEVADAIPDARLVVIPGDGGAEIAAIHSFLNASTESAARASAGPEPNRAVHLTPRETEVIRLIARGRTNREISSDLFLSERTVARHITNIYDKLGLRSKAEATSYAFRHQLA
jgi:pimeloyl-ACP methyl ester carboxylesterase/DNA-binding CsgD family transcriptional regulator